MLYAYTENFMLPFSRDEVVHGKGSLLSKMPGDTWQKFANLRQLIAYMYTHPGKKLLFMGTELAPWNEWTHAHSLEWHLNDDPMRQGLQHFMEDLGELYHRESPLWQWDFSPEGFRWIDCSDSDSGVISYARYSEGRHLVVVLNLTPIVRYNYRVGAPAAGAYIEALNTDSEHYGGSNVGNLGRINTENTPFHGHPQSFNLTLPPLSALVLAPV